MSATGTIRHVAARVSTTDIWKAAALLLILVDHFGHFLAPDADWMRIVGRASLPIWFFLIGFATTRTVPWTWPVLGLGLTALDAWYMGSARATYLNILLNFALIRLALPMIERHVWPSAWRLTVFVLLLAAFAPWANLVIEYGTEGWLLALVGLAHRHMLEARGPGAQTGETFWRRVALAVSAGAVFVVLEARDHRFDTNETAALILLVLLVSALLGSFRRTELKIALPAPAAALLRLCGRQSLWLYAGQIVALTIAASLIDK